MTEADDVAGTGDARVDEAVARLGELASAPLDEHPVILSEIHDRLREVLGELGSDAPGVPGVPGGRSGPGTPSGPGARGTP